MVVGNKDELGRKKEKGKNFERSPSVSFPLFLLSCHNSLF